MKLQLGHYDDKKEKWQSHEVRFTIQSIHNFMEKISYNGDILDIIGYGETKEEAFENFKTKYRKLLLNFQAFDKELDDITENDIVPVDYRGYMQEESKKMTLYSNKELLANNTSEVLHFLDSKEVILLDILERFDKTYAVAFLLNNRKIAILKYITNFNNWCTLEINKSQYIYIDQPTNIVYLNTCSNSTQSADSTQYTIYLCKEIVEDLINGKDVTKYSNINNYLKYMTINSYEEYMNLIKIISSSEFIHYEITWAGTTNIDSMEYPFVKIKELKNNLNNMDNYKYILFTDNFKNYKVVEKIGNTVTCLFTKAFNF